MEAFARATKIFEAGVTLKNRTSNWKKEVLSHSENSET
jgi:hypothetical protein